MTRAWALPLVAVVLSCGPGGPPPASGGAGQASAGAPAPAPAPAPVPAPAMPSPSLAAPGPADPITARVTAVSRQGDGVLEVRVVLRNGGAVPLALSAGAGASDQPAGALAAAVLEDAGSQYRTGVLRDGRGTPLCSADPGEIPAAGEREAWLRFAVDERRPEGLRLRIPGLSPVELPGAGG